MYFRTFCVLNRVRVSNPQRLTYTQILVEFTPPGGRGASIPNLHTHLKASGPKMHPELIFLKLEISLFN